MMETQYNIKLANFFTPRKKISNRLIASKTAQTELIPKLKIANKTCLKQYSLSDLEKWCQKNEEDTGRANQLWKWMYRDGVHVDDLRDTVGLTNGFSSTFCKKAEYKANIHAPMNLTSTHCAKDGTRKLVFTMKETGNRIESVIIPSTQDREEIKRYTLCVSSQVGCGMNCKFCNTGKMGLLQNLSVDFIVDQVVMACRIMAKENNQKSLSNTSIKNIVFMGMGEPLNNLNSVLTACDILTHPKGLNFSPRKVCVSTVGLVPEIRKFCLQSNVELAISLHATTDEMRDNIMPINKRYNLKSLISVLEEFFPLDKNRTTKFRGHVFIEYLMLRDINDSEADAMRLLDITKNLFAKYNLIVFNEFEGCGFFPSPMERILKFQSILKELGGRVATIRHSKGQDEMAACGMLGGRAIKIN